ncbi:MAG: PAS domain S-box protein [Alphaproteobacteria bacterium]|nr:PAS domain S-box protein [Alphaproteobacteria bacterium]
MQINDLGEIEAQILSLRTAVALTEGAVSERDRIIDQLLQRARWFDEVADKAPFAIHRKAPDGEFLWGNRAFSETFGGPREDGIGAPNQDALSSLEVPARDKKVGGRVYRRQECALVDGAGDPVGSIAFDTDITELKWSEDLVEQLTGDLNDRLSSRVLGLKRSEERFRDFAEVASDWFWETGPDHRFTFLSERFEQATGVQMADVLGKKRNEVRRDSFLAEPELWSRHLGDLENRRAFRDFEFDWTTPEGRPVVARLNGKPVFDENGDFQGYRAPAWT